jgi:hypothetical protein
MICSNVTEATSKMQLLDGRQIATTWKYRYLICAGIMLQAN